MEKDFDNWHNKKKEAQNIEKRPLFSEGQVWWCSLGVNIGDKQDGKGENFTRPVLILKKFNRNICLVIPMSTQIKEHPFYHKIYFKGKYQSLLILQMRTIDTKRFKDKMGEV